MTDTPAVFISEFAQRLIENGIVDEADNAMEPCTEDEIRIVEQSLNVTLPAIYRDYLAVMGRSAGCFLQGEEHSYPDILELRNWANELLEECEIDYRISSTSVVVWMSQGTQFAFFDTRDGEDPPVYHYRESDPAPVKRLDQFSQYLTYMLDGQLQVRSA